MKNTFAGEKIVYYDCATGESVDKLEVPTGKEINREAIYDFLLYNTVLPPNSIRNNVCSLFPGEEISRSENGYHLSNEEYQELANLRPINKGIEYFVNRLDLLMADYVAKQVFLSGGGDILD